jgi:hypothetical protein
MKDRENLLAGGKMQRSMQIPRRRLGKPLRRAGEPEPGISIARTITNHQQASGRNPGGEPLQQSPLFVRRQVMQDIEKDHVPAAFNWVGDVDFGKMKIAIMAPGHRAGSFNFASISIDPVDPRLEISLPQIEGEEANTATDIDKRSIGIPE